MPKKILLIESDQAFAAGISEPLEAAGFEVRATGDGRVGLDLAREWGPDAVVLCVELPGMSGYLVCQKLKKDDALKALPLVLTSAEATEETFEKHRTLKARADEYLLKPYEAGALIEKLGSLVGLPEGYAQEGEEPGEEELVSLEEELGLEASAEGSPDEELGLDALGDEPVAREGGTPSEDDDLRLLDDAFDGLSAPPAGGDADANLDELSGERPVAVDDLDAAAASLPDEDEGTARADLAAFGDDAEAALGALGGADESLTSMLDAQGPPPVPARPLRGASADLLRAAGIKLLGNEPSPRATSSGGSDVERLDQDLADARAALERAQAELAERDSEISELKSRSSDVARRAEEADARADAAAAQVRKAENDARRAADQAKGAEVELGELRRRLDDAERRAETAEGEARRSREEAAAAADAVGRAEALEREAEELRTELVVARGEAEGAQAEIEKRTADLRRRLSEAEAASAKNEERVVRAYQKIKADEKVRDKVRKAIAIAAQLLEEGLSSADPAEKDRRAAGRE
jgi:CheY-like chemotaxis protein